MHRFGTCTSRNVEKKVSFEFRPNGVCYLITRVIRHVLRYHTCYTGVISSDVLFGCYLITLSDTV